MYACMYRRISFAIDNKIYTSCYDENDYVYDLKYITKSVTYSEGFGTYRYLQNK